MHELKSNNFFCRQTLVHNIAISDELKFCLKFRRKEGNRFNFHNIIK